MMQTKLKMIVCMFPYKMSKLHQFQSQYYSLQAAFGHSLMEKMSSDSGILPQVVNLRMFLSSLRILEHPEDLFSGTQKTEETLKNMKHTERSNSQMCSTPMVCYVRITLIIKQSEEMIISK